MKKYLFFILTPIFFWTLSPSTHAQEKLNLIIDADTGNEVDDLYALTRAFIEPTWSILAVNAAHWQTSHWTVENSMENSHRLNQTLLGLLGMNLKTNRGSTARMYDWGDQAQHSAAAYDIIERAQALEPSEKLTIVALGALTNIASAIFIEPSIAKKLTLHWLGTTYDFKNEVLRKNDFNCVMDITALDFLLFSEVEMHIIPVNVAAAMVFNYQETYERLNGKHRVCDYILERWAQHLDSGQKERVLWDLALISAIIHPEWRKEVAITTSKDNGNRQVYFIESINAPAMKEEFYETVVTTLQKWKLMEEKKGG